MNALVNFGNDIGEGHAGCGLREFRFWDAK
jgi:hypothetical protein